MSNQGNEYKGSTIKQLILVIPGTILILTLLISLLAKSFSTSSESAPSAAALAKVEENIKPLATVEVASADAGPHVDKSGEEVVKAVCSACHGGGLMGSPKIGDKAAWGPRIAQGYDTLVNHAIHGIRGMPAKGGNSSLSEGEIANAVAFMADSGGANFKAPAPKAADAAPAAEATKPVEAVKPVAEAATAVAAVAVAAKTETKVAGKSGEEVFKATCAMCHNTGMMNAPKFGDKEAWKPRIAQGYDTLVNHAVNGIRSMPAKGGNSSLSDDEVAGAVKYMANDAGAGFK
ncbi:MAG: c-type cytochrome [Methylophilaceae bacterium]